MRPLSRILLAAFTAILLVSLCSCGKKQIKTIDEPGKPASGPEEGTKAEWNEQISDEGKSVCDAGSVSLTVPDGWKAFPVSDMMGDYNSEHDPNAINVYKDAVNILDTRSKPYIEIRYYPPESSDFSAETEKELYSSVEDITAFKTGEYTWNGFSGANGQTNITVLTAMTENAGKLTLTMFMNTDESSFTLEDMDVLEIMSGISVKS